MSAPVSWSRILEGLRELAEAMDQAISA